MRKGITKLNWIQKIILRAVVGKIIYKNLKDTYFLDAEHMNETKKKERIEFWKPTLVILIGIAMLFFEQSKTLAWFVIPFGACMYGWQR